jgi:uncharacterized protein YacL
MFCPNCGKEIPDGSNFCPFCGYQITGGSEKEKVQTVELTSKRLKAQLLFAILTIVIGFLLLSIGSYKLHLTAFSSSGPSPIGTIISVIGTITMLIGIVWYVITRIMIWWYHR